MTPGKFQAVTEALMAWIFPGGPGNFQGLPKPRCHGFFQGAWKFPGGSWKNPGNLPISLWSQGEMKEP